MGITSQCWIKKKIKRSEKSVDRCFTPTWFFEIFKEGERGDC